MSSDKNPDGDPASEPGRGTPMLPRPEEVLDRQRRLADYQTAWRSFTPALEKADADRGRALARELHEWLETLDHQLQSAQARPLNTESADREANAIGNSLERLDDGLDRYAELLCNQLEGVPQDRLCTHLPVEDVEQNSGFAELIDFILAAHPDLERHGALLDHLVTMLSTREQGGRRRVVRDPATLTPTLRSLSERAAANSDLDLSEIEREFVEAARHLEEGLTGRSFSAMHARKVELGCTILAPQILRSVVFYNVATRNVGRGGGSNGTPSNAIDSDVSAARVRAVADVKAPEDPARRDPMCGPDRSTDSTGAPGLAGDAPDVPEVQWRIDPTPANAPSARTPEPLPSQRRTRARRGVMVASLAAALLLATPFWWSGSRDTVQVLSKFDLQAISTQLDSGYRDDFGAGPLFIGTVGAEWDHLSSAERERSALEIVARLGESGVREILLYDRSQRTALHFAEGLPLRIGL